MKDANLAHKLICFGIEKITIFQGAKIGVTTQLMQKHAPYLSGVHYMAHCTNVLVATLSSLRLVSKVENLLAGMYNSFTHNTKWHLEFCKLANILKSKGNKILKNIKKHDGYPCYHHVIEFLQNINFWWWKWLKIVATLRMQKMTTNYCVVEKHYQGWLAFYLVWKLCKGYLNSHNGGHLHLWFHFYLKVCRSKLLHYVLWQWEEL